MKRIERKVYYKMQFCMGAITSDDVNFVREAMNKLEKHPAIMTCFQNTNMSVFRDNDWQEDNNPSSDFSIYYREPSVDAIDRFMFKIQLRFPNCKVSTSQTLQEHF